MGILSTLENFLAEAKSGDTTKSKKGKEVSVESGAKGREKVKIGEKSYGPDDKYTVKVKGKEGEVVEKTKKKAAKFTKYVDKKKEADKSSVTNTKDEAKAKAKAENAGKKKGGKKRVAKWWQDEEELKKVIMVDPKAKRATQKAIETIRSKDSEKKEEPKKEEKKPAKTKKVPAKEVVKKNKIAAESIYPKNPKAIKSLIEEYFNPQTEEVRNFFKK
ncbi:MAG TPA: hypothetical protein PLS71_24930 [Leptospiraceae bacterium]|nr:hypothetical protein [Leptospiraceae bacterium]